jgi:hypothetical protein
MEPQKLRHVATHNALLRVAASFDGKLGLWSDLNKRLALDCGV